MSDSTQEHVHVVKRRAPVEVLSKEFERQLWEREVLNVTDSMGLSRAVYFYVLKAFGVFSRNELRDVKIEQFWYGEDEIGKYIGFLDNDESGGRSSQATPTRRVRQYDDISNDYSVYKVFTTYMMYIPSTGEFFRRPLFPTKECQKPIQFSDSPIGINTLSHYLPDMVRDAGMEEHFTPQSIKSYVVSILFRAGFDEELLRQRTRWWIVPSRLSLNPGVFTPSQFPSQAAGLQPQRQQILAISKMLDPPVFSLTQENAFDGQLSSVTLVVPPESISTSSSQYFSAQPPSRQQHHHKPTHLHQVDPANAAIEYKWFTGESSHGGDSDSEGVYAKRPRLQGIGTAQDVPAIPLKISKAQISLIKEGSEESELCVVGSAHPGFIALSGPVNEESSMPSLQISRPISGREDEDKDSDCCVVLDQAYARNEQQTNSITSSNRVASKTSPRVKNQMQCMSNTEMKEVSARPPGEGTSSLSLAFKFAYEIDHNGEVAANREVRAMHATANEDGPKSSTRRRLLPLNVVDSKGQDAADRQAELPNFVIKLSDFFPSIGRQQVDIMDVVIRGTRGQGIDRLNVELVMAEPDEQIAEYSIID